MPKKFPVRKPPVIVDTNGAGDSFVGGMNIQNLKMKIRFFKS